MRDVVRCSEAFKVRLAEEVAAGGIPEPQRSGPHDRLWTPSGVKPSTRAVYKPSTRIVY
jgi:hypothetical protein